MDATTRSAEQEIGWVPVTGIQLRKSGVVFDAVRLDGVDGCRVADCLERMTNGDPGPIVAERDGRGGTYFLLPPGSTLRKRWPVGAVRYNAQTAETGYVPVPALSGDTWPFSWRCPPGEPGRFVHPLLLCNAIVAVRLVTPAAEEFVSRARGT